MAETDCEESEKERARRLACKQKQRQRTNMQPLARELSERDKQ